MSDRNPNDFFEGAQRFLLKLALFIVFVVSVIKFVWYEIAPLLGM
jgi:hypothetical protein